VANANREPRFFLNSYRPLIATPVGRIASERHEIPPFVDGSIRREPDLQHQWPTISCLCRAGLFAPRLCVNDFVTYITVKGAERGQRRLTAVLKVMHVFDSHDDAARWFRERNIPLPSNCMVKGNPALPLGKSLGKSRTCREGCGQALHREWDAGYRQRADDNGRFVVCQPLFIDLSWEAPIVDDAHLHAAFDRIPVTRNPPSLPWSGLHRLVQLLKLPVSGLPSSP
jgi:hypothetical protein